MRPTPGPGMRMLPEAAFVLKKEPSHPSSKNVADAGAETSSAAYSTPGSRPSFRSTDGCAPSGVTISDSKYPQAFPFENADSVALQIPNA